MKRWHWALVLASSISVVLAGSVAGTHYVKQGMLDKLSQATGLHIQARGLGYSFDTGLYLTDVSFSRDSLDELARCERFAWGKSCYELSGVVAELDLDSLAGSCLDGLLSSQYAFSVLSGRLRITRQDQSLDVTSCRFSLLQASEEGLCKWASSFSFHTEAGGVFGNGNLVFIRDILERARRKEAVSLCDLLPGVSAQIEVRNVPSWLITAQLPGSYSGFIDCENSTSGFKLRSPLALSCKDWAIAVTRLQAKLADSSSYKQGQITSLPLPQILDLRAELSGQYKGTIFATVAAGDFGAKDVAFSCDINSSDTVLEGVRVSASMSPHVDILNWQGWRFMRAKGSCSRALWDGVLIAENYKASYDPASRRASVGMQNWDDRALGLFRLEASYFDARPFGFNAAGRCFLSLARVPSEIRMGVFSNHYEADIDCEPTLKIQGKGYFTEKDQRLNSHVLRSPLTVSTSLDGDSLVLAIDRIDVYTSKSRHLRGLGSLSLGPHLQRTLIMPDIAAFEVDNFGIRLGRKNHSWLEARRLFARWLDSRTRF